MALNGGDCCGRVQPGGGCGQIGDGAAQEEHPPHSSGRLWLPLKRWMQVGLEGIASLSYKLYKYGLDPDPDPTGTGGGVLQPYSRLIVDHKTGIRNKK